MSVSAGGQGPREKSRTPKPKAGDALAVPLSTPQTSALPAAVANDASTDPIVDDSARSSAPKYGIFSSLAFASSIDFSHFILLCVFMPGSSFLLGGGEGWGEANDYAILCHLS